MIDLGKILYVEDDEDIRRVTSLVFELSGLDVEICVDGYDALDRLKTVKPNLAIIDVMMPGIDGVMLFNAIREQGLAFPIIFVTAKTQRQEIETYLNLGSIGVISKPFDPSTLVDEIKSLYQATL